MAQEDDAGQFARSKGHDDAAAGLHAMLERHRKRVGKRMIERNRKTDVTIAEGQLMKVYEIRETKGIESLREAERVEPRPAHGQVKVRVKAVSLNYRDLSVVRGAYGRGVTLPLIPCSDGAGEVVELGPGVTRWAVGDRVAGIFMQ